MKDIKEVITNNIIISDSGCWEWQRYCLPSGYGQVRRGKKLALIHREAYTAFIGTIPKGLVVCHKCDNRKCCNPSHLFIGTQQDNINDMVSKGRAASGERNGRSKLTSKEIENIRADKRVFHEIASDYHIDRSHVSRIKSKDRWCDSDIGIKDKQQKES